MKHGYVYELEAEVVRLHRRRMWHVYLFAFVTFLGTGVAWLHHAFPQAPVPFVLEAR